MRRKKEGAKGIRRPAGKDKPYWPTDNWPLPYWYISTLNHASTADRLDSARSRCLQRSQLIEDTVEPSFSCPGVTVYATAVRKSAGCVTCCLSRDVKISTLSK